MLVKLEISTLCQFLYYRGLVVFFPSEVLTCRNTVQVTSTFNLGIPITISVYSVCK